MKISRQSAALTRSFTIIAALAVLVGGATFAALRSQNNVLSGSRMTSASADLTMAKINNGQWYTSLQGFNFDNIAPGGSAGPRLGNDLYFRNAGSTYLQLSFSVDGQRLSNPYGLNLTKTRLVIVDNNNTVFANPTINDLTLAFVNGTPLPVNLDLGPNSITHLKVRMQLDSGAIATTDQGLLENIDIVFSGTAVES